MLEIYQKNCLLLKNKFMDILFTEILEVPDLDLLPNCEDGFSFL